MKLLFISDPHFAVKLPHANVSASGTRSDRLEDVVSVFDDVAQYAQSSDALFILGDLFDSSSPCMATLEVVGQTIKRLADILPVIILPGNHDAHDRAGNLYTLSLFESLKLPNVRVLLKPGVAFRAGDVTFWAVPWRPDDVAAAMIKSFGFANVNVNVCLLHQTVDSCLDGKRRLSSPLKPDLFDRFDLALSGHIHCPQTIGNLQYLGAPLQLRFGEEDVERGFWVLDTATMQLDLVPLFTTPLFMTRHVDEQNPSTLDSVETFSDDLVRELQVRDVYVSFTVRGTSSFIESVEEVLLDAVRDAEDQWASGFCLKIRKFRIRKVATDGGASTRVRSVLSTGGISTPVQLAEAFVNASTALPEGMTEAGLRALGVKALVES